MKKKMISAVLAICCAVMLFTITAFADGGTLRAPANVSQGEAATIAARLYAARVGDDISAYNALSQYTAYAATHQLFSHVTIGPDYSVPITRSSAVRLFVNALGTTEFTSKTTADVVIPDVLEGDANYAIIKSLYQAGILKGVDEYGYFLPDEPLTDVQANYLITALTDESLRAAASVQTETYEVKRARYLIDDYKLTDSGKLNVASGWILEDTANQPNQARVAEDNKYVLDLNDNSSTGHVVISRDFDAVTGGIMCLDVQLQIKKNDGTAGLPDGVRVYFTDGTSDNIFAELYSSNNKLWFKDAAGAVTDLGLNLASSNAPAPFMRLLFDMDNHTAIVYWYGRQPMQINISSSVTSVSRLYIGTSDAGTGISLRPLGVHLYTDYLVNDTFADVGNAAITASDGRDGFTRSAGGTAIVDGGGSWNSGGTAYGSVPGSYNWYNLKITAPTGDDTYVQKSFPFNRKVGGTVVFETYLLMREADSNGVYVSLIGGGREIARVYTNNNAFWYNGTKLRDFTTDVWQLVRIEANLNTGKADIKIDGKKVAEGVDLQTWVEHADTIKIGMDNTTGSEKNFYVDDIKVFRLPEYSDYVPEPTPVQSDYYLIMSVCNLWRNDAHYGWDLIAPFEEAVPYLGYYDEGETEEMDWEIKYLVEHGINVYRPCWFMPGNGSQQVPIMKPTQGYALIDGYMNAKYSDMIKFSILWENQGDSYDESSIDYEYFKNNIWKYWVEWYFTDSRYFTIDNKPVLNIYKPDNFIAKAGGSTTNAKALVDWMRSEITKYKQDGADSNFSGMIIIFDNESENGATNLKTMGADAADVYGFGPLNYDATWQEKKHEAVYDINHAKGVDFLPVVGPGKNAVPWDQGRTPLADKTSFKDVLSYIKNTYLPNHYGTTGWKSKYVLFDTWNEYGEGHYIMPTSLHGFDYLDAIKETFTSSTVSCSTTDVQPTPSQKARMGQLYTGQRELIKRLWNVSDVPDLSNYSAVKSWDYTKSGSYLYVDADRMTVTSRYGTDGFVGTTKKTAIMQVGSSNYAANTNLRITASSAKLLHVNMKADMPSRFRMYFQTDGSGSYTESMAESFYFDGSDTYKDYYIDLTKVANWSGTIQKLRFDIQDAGVKFYIKKIELMNYTQTGQATEKKLTLTTNSTDWGNSPNQIRSYDATEVYYAIKHNDGFLTNNRLSYEWSHKTGKLLLKTYDGKKIEFTVGSNICYVNGSAVTLSKAVEKFDGMPVIPLKFFFTQAGITYTYDYSGKTLSTTIATTSTT